MENGHKKLLMRNLVTSLVLHEKIKTTEAKARALQPVMEKVINKAKNPDSVVAIRSINSIVNSELSAKKLVEKIGKKYQNRESGYTRIVKLGYRAGDAAPLVQIELI